jgi:hypothetical protein
MPFSVSQSMPQLPGYELKQQLVGIFGDKVIDRLVVYTCLLPLPVEVYKLVLDSFIVSGLCMVQAGNGKVLGLHSDDIAGHLLNCTHPLHKRMKNLLLCTSNFFKIPSL